MPTHLRHFVFTLNNPQVTPDELWSILQSKAAYLVFQKESGTNGTPHFQGYCELRRQSRFTTIKNLLPSAHIEPRRGTQAQAIDYCTKDETRVEGPFEYGDKPEKRPGSRNDLHSFRDAIVSGKSRRELLVEFPNELAKYPRFVSLVRSTQRRKLRSVHVSLYYGEPGTGKTRKAWEDNEELYVIPLSDTLWFDGYDGQTNVLLDDFSGWMKLQHLLRLLDIYPIDIPVKGGFVPFEATKIIITSNKHPMHWYDWNKHGDVYYRALLRRFHNITHFKSLHEWSIEQDVPAVSLDSVEDSVEPERLEE